MSADKALVANLHAPTLVAAARLTLETLRRNGAPWHQVSQISLALDAFDLHLEQAKPPELTPEQQAKVKEGWTPPGYGMRTVEVAEFDGNMLITKRERTLVVIDRTASGRDIVDIPGIGLTILETGGR